MGKYIFFIKILNTNSLFLSLFAIQKYVLIPVGKQIINETFLLYSLNHIISPYLFIISPITFLTTLDNNGSLVALYSKSLL